MARDTIPSGRWLWIRRRTLAILAIPLTFANFTGREAQAGEATNAAPPARHLIVVEDTTQMKRQRKAAADAISRLVLSGFNGRARKGDWVEIWLVADGLATNRFSGFGWDSEQAVDRSNQSFRFLSGLSGSTKSAALGRVPVTATATQPAEYPVLLVYLTTSGLDPLLGTPFVDQVNSIFVQHGDRLRKAKLPFITVLLADDRGWVGHAVTPGDRIPFIPRLPAKPAATKPSAELPASQLSTASAHSASSSAAQPRPLSVEEISRKLKESELNRARISAEPALVVAPAPALVPPATNELTTTNAAVPGNSLVMEVGAPGSEEAPRGSLVASGTDKSVPTGGSATLHDEPGMVSDPALSLSKPDGAESPRVYPSRTSEPSVLATPWRELGIGILLLLAAVALLVVLMRNFKAAGDRNRFPESLRGGTPSQRKPG